MKETEEKKTNESADQSDELQDEFIRERVLNREAARRRKQSTISRVIALILSAVLFGAVASLVFVMLVPRLQKKTEPEETAVVVPSDEEIESAAETETAETEDSEEKIEEIIESAVESRTWDADDYENLLKAMTDIAAEANKGIVTVYVSTPETDIFGNESSTVNQISGAIWNISDSEIMILTTAQKSDGDSTVEVSFCDGSTVPAMIEGTDSKTGISVVSVQKADVGTQTMNVITALPLGNSRMTAAGSGIICVGSPKEYVGSIDFGIVSYVRSGVMTEDSESTVFELNFVTDDNSDGFIIDMNKNILGVILPGMTGTVTSAVSISDLKATIQKLANGESIAYLGITGQDVTEVVHIKNKIPRGIYISDLAIDGPAFEAGLQAGDVLTKVGDTEITTADELETALMGQTPGTAVSVTVMRSDKDTYTELSFDVALGQR